MIALVCLLFQNNLGGESDEWQWFYDGIDPVFQNSGASVEPYSDRKRNKVADMKQVVLTTDGSCDRNPGPGGWAYRLRYDGRFKESRGRESETTNNRMELRAVIEGLRALKEPCAVTVRTDSRYVMDGMTKWMRTWKSKGWVHKEKGKAGKQPVKNRDLWEELETITGVHQIEWQWVKGHSNDTDNERCHRLAEMAAHSNT